MSKFIRAVSLLLVISVLPLTLVFCGTGDTTQTTDVESTSSTTQTTNKDETESQTQTETETETETGEETTLMDISAVFPKAEQAKIVYTLQKPTNAYDLLTAVTLQGLVAKNGDQQIIFNSTQTPIFLEIFKESHNVKIANGNNIWVLLKKFASDLDGYILCDIGDDSINVANSLSSLLNALVVTEQNKAQAEECGLTMLLDVRDKDDAWLRKSTYWGKFNTKLAITTSVEDPYYLRDYAIVAGAYVFRSDDDTKQKFLSRVAFMDDNFTIFGWHGIGEYSTVDALSSVNGSIIPADWSYNLSTYSGFSLDYLKQKAPEPKNDNLPKKGHTVCFVLSDGDNLQWTQGDYVTSQKWFASPIRTSETESFNMGWGLPASLIDVAPAVLQYFYQNMTSKDNFTLQLSGTGYTFPSKWKNPNSVLEMAAQVNTLMGRMDMGILEILDDDALTPLIVKNVYSKFTEQDNIDALLYINYHDYARYNGAIHWSNGKPIISARYKLWADHETIDSLANKINTSSLDRSSVSGYTFVTVHAWSGLTDGELKSGGNTMEAIAAVIAKLNPYVEVVTPDEFINRIIENKVGQ